MKLLVMYFFPFFCRLLLRPTCCPQLATLIYPLTIVLPYLEAEFHTHTDQQVLHVLMFVDSKWEHKVFCN